MIQNKKIDNAHVQDDLSKVHDVGQVTNFNILEIFGSKEFCCDDKQNDFDDDNDDEEADYRCPVCRKLMQHPNKRR